MEPVAYGLLGLTPEAFAAATPRELIAMAEARLDRLNEAREFAASLVLPLVRLLSRKPVTLDQFLGPRYVAWKLTRDQRQEKPR